MYKANLREIRVFANDCVTVVTSKSPNVFVWSGVEIVIRDVATFWIEILDTSNESMRQVLIQQKLHADAAYVTRSRSAANSRAARMSSFSRSGKSVRISSYDIPEAR